MKSRKITGILLACCALLMVAIAGLGVTMAKYVKDAPEKGGTAHVAAFGVSLAWQGESIFKEEYDTNDDAVKGTISTSVKSSTDVIAPGTTGSVTLSFANSTASEVAFNLKINISQTYSDNWKKSANGEVYHPIIYNVTSTAKANGVDIAGISGNSVAIDQNFAAGTTLSGTITITWSWPFEAEESASADDKKAKDDADTYMGGVSGATYSITANATATQID